MKQHKARYGVARLARVLGVSRSGYYMWEKRKPSKYDKEEQKLAELIKQIFINHLSRYGSPRMWEELKDLGWRISHKRVERIMREQGLCARKRRKHVKTTNSSHFFSFAGNILNQNFEAAFPGEKWVSDITYLRANSGWLYLTIILDLWDRKVIGWSMGDDLTAEQTCLALQMAVKNRTPRKELIFHSDRGIQYCSDEFVSKLKELCPSVRQSMSRKGNCWDNACAESFFKTLKVELDLSKRRYDKKQLKIIIFEYIEVYYNRRRRHSALGYATPIALTSNFAA